MKHQLHKIVHELGVKALLSLDFVGASQQDEVEQPDVSVLAVLELLDDSEWRHEVVIEELGAGASQVRHQISWRLSEELSDGVPRGG